MNPWRTHETLLLEMIPGWSTRHEVALLNMSCHLLHQLVEEHLFLLPCLTSAFTENVLGLVPPSFEDPSVLRHHPSFLSEKLLFLPASLCNIITELLLQFSELSLVSFKSILSRLGRCVEIAVNEPLDRFAYHLEVGG